MTRGQNVSECYHPAGKVGLNTNQQHTMPASPPYIPPADSDFDIWLQNFATLIQATPTAYGLVSGDGTIIDGVRDTWTTAYATANTPATRTSANIAAKDVARVNAEAVARPYAQRIRANASVSDALKIGLGLNLQPATLTPIPAPTDAPAIALRSQGPQRTDHNYNIAGAVSGKNKPYGAIGVELVATVGTSDTSDPDSAAVITQVTKSPFALTWAAGDVGKVLSLWGRFVTRSGPGGQVQKGPWSARLTTTIS